MLSDDYWEKMRQTQLDAEMSSFRPTRIAKGKQVKSGKPREMCASRPSSTRFSRKDCGTSRQSASRRHRQHISERSGQFSQRAIAHHGFSLGLLGQSYLGNIITRQLFLLHTQHAHTQVAVIASCRDVAFRWHTRDRRRANVHYVLRDIDFFAPH